MSNPREGPQWVGTEHLPIFHAGHSSFDREFTPHSTVGMC